MIANFFGSKVEKKNRHGVEPAAGFRLGERVHNRRYGKGYVHAFNPNGTLVVRFDGQKKSRSVFPTFLDRNTP